jgi:glyoxylase-like metal-dependent hydrolase (beta-lactamase superfamily II)
MKSAPFVENEVKEVGPGVWLRVAIDNIAWADLGNCGVIIDALEDPTQADVVRGLLKETTGQDLRYVVNTHWDTDHISCNPQWKREGAVIVAHESNARSAGDWEGRPDVTFGDDSVFTDVGTLRGAGDRRIEMTFVGGTHTPWDTILYFPHAKVLHIADLFGWGLIPCKPTPEKIALLRRILKHVQSYDCTAVICGHGPDTTLEHLARFSSYLEMMLEQVPPLLAKGLSLQEVESEIPPPADMSDWWRFTAWKHAKNIELIQQFWREG